MRDDLVLGAFNVLFGGEALDDLVELLFGEFHKMFGLMIKADVRMVRRLAAQFARSRNGGCRPAGRTPAPKNEAWMGRQHGSPSNGLQSAAARFCPCPGSSGLWFGCPGGRPS